MGQSLVCYRAPWVEEVREGPVVVEAGSPRVARGQVSRGGGFGGLGSCCEPAGSISTTHWSYVGDGRGGYEKVQTYEFVGEGSGSFDKETAVLHYGLRPRACCVVCGFLAVLAAVLYAIFGLQHSFHTDWRSYVLIHRQVEGGAGHKAVVVIKPRYSCVVGTASDRLPLAPTGHMAICAAALLEAVWRAVDADGDGRISRSDMAACEQGHLLSPAAIQVLKSGDTDGDGTLDLHECSAALSKAGLASGEIHGGLVDVTTMALVEAAWLSMDKDASGSIARPELDVLTRQRQLSARTLQVFMAEDGDSNGALSREEFEAGLTKCGRSSFVVSRGSHAVIDVAIAEAAWVVTSDNGGTVGKAELLHSEDRKLLPPDALRALRLELAHGSNRNVLTHGQFVGALVGARLSDAFVELARAEPGDPATFAATAGGAGRGTPVERWSAAKRLWCCTNAGVACASSTTQPPPSFDCQAGLDQWAQLWPSAKKQWCCEHAHVGCEPYDCVSGYSDWEHKWSFGQKKWCCANKGRGCPPVTSQPFDCEAGYDRWATGWSIEKKAWCCAHFERGCAAPDTRTYDCDAGFDNWVHGWSLSKKDWCCQRFRRGCPTADAYNCQEGFATWPSSWPAAKKEWCCQHHNRGCMTTSAPFDCNADYLPCYHCLMDRWSVAKRSWCCQHARRGCTTTTPLPFNCADGLATWERSWTLPKKVWCCQHEQRGCPKPPTTSPALFNCDEGYSQWESMWPPLKKAWCCQHHKRGCPSTTMTTSLPFDCNIDFTTCYHCLEKRWSPAKRTWCCQHTNRGCVTTAAPTTLPFDCTAALSNWERAWSPAKKAWCCQHEHRGCPDVRTSLPFDCAAGLSNAERGWSVAKKSWCCTHERLGCDASMTRNTRFDCQLTSSNLVHDWSDDQKSWCCEKFNVGCRERSSEVNCLVGFSNWKDDWSTAKKAYCCEHYQRGCSNAAATNATAA